MSVHVFTTYSSTLQYVMEACAENKKKLIVLDPDPTQMGIMLMALCLNLNLNLFRL